MPGLSENSESNVKSTAVTPYATPYSEEYLAELKRCDCDDKTARWLATVDQLKSKIRDLQVQRLPIGGVSLTTSEMEHADRMAKRLLGNIIKVCEVSNSGPSPRDKTVLHIETAGPDYVRLEFGINDYQGLEMQSIK